MTQRCLIEVVMQEIQNSGARGENGDGARHALRAWLARNGLTPNSAAKKAGVSVGSIYNFLDGRSQSLSSGVLLKLAQVVGDSVDALLTGVAPEAKSHIYVTHRVGGRGEMFDVDDLSGDRLKVTRPPGIAADADVAAAVIEGQGLHPVPSGWVVFFESAARSPEMLLGQVAVVRYSGGGPRPVIRTIRRGSRAGTFTLQAFTGELLEDVEVTAAHRVISFAAPEVDAQV